MFSFSLNNHGSITAMLVIVPRLETESRISNDQIMFCAHTAVIPRKEDHLLKWRLGLYVTNYKSRTGTAHWTAITPLVWNSRSADGTGYEDPGEYES